MEYVYGALLLHKLGKDVNEDNLRKVISSVDHHPDDSKIKSLVVSLKGVDIAKELENASLVAAAPAAGSAPVAEKHEEKKHEEKKEAAAEGLSALFG